MSEEDQKADAMEVEEGVVEDNQMGGGEEGGADVAAEEKVEVDPEKVEKERRATHEMDAKSVLEKGIMNLRDSDKPPLPPLVEPTHSRLKSLTLPCPLQLFLRNVEKGDANFVYRSIRVSCVR